MKKKNKVIIVGSLVMAYGLFAISALIFALLMLFNVL
jgi:hypothetical protein